MMLLRARSFSSGATASSQSRNTTSAADCAALANRPTFEPGTASSERCTRGRACSIVVKLIRCSSLKSARTAEPACYAINRKQQGCLDGIALRVRACSTVAAQKLNLQSVRLRNVRQLSRQSSAQARKTPGDVVTLAHLQQHPHAKSMLFPQ